MKSNSILEAIDKGALLVDVRTPEEFMDGSVEGAINIPLDEIPERVEEFTGKGEIILFCQSGNRSEHAKMYLEHHDIEDLWNGGGWYDVDYLVSQNKENN